MPGMWSPRSTAAREGRAGAREGALAAAMAGPDAPCGAEDSRVGQRSAHQRHVAVCGPTSLWRMRLKAVHITWGSRATASLHVFSGVDADNQRSPH